MNNTRQRSLILVMGIFVACLLILAGAWISTVKPAGASTQALTVDYHMLGEVNFEWASTGTYATVSQTVELTSTVLSDLGSMDLGLWLDAGNGTMGGYVDLGNTLVFTTENNIDLTLGLSTTQEAVGPSVVGSFDGTTFDLLSQPFTLQTQSGETATRQFWMQGAIVDGVATGQYRETVTGLTLQPMTIVGGFDMVAIPAVQLVPTAVMATGFSAGAASITMIVVALAVALLGATVMLRRRKSQLQEATLA